MDAGPSGGPAVRAFGGRSRDLRPWVARVPGSYRAVVDATSNHPLYCPPARIVPLDTQPRVGRRQGALEAVDARGRTMAWASFDGSATSDCVELSLVLGPLRPPTELVGELVRRAATLAADAGASRLVIDFDPGSRLTREVMAASSLDWRERPTSDGAVAEVSLGEAVAPEGAPVAGNASVVRTHPRGVTLLPSAEGPSLRSDPRWTAGRARRSDRLLDHLVARRQASSSSG
jgi:hypothetical protein